MCGRGYLLYQPEIVHEPGHTKTEYDKERATWPDGTPSNAVRIINKREVPDGLDWAVKSKFDYLGCGWEDEELRFATKEEAEAQAQEWLENRNVSWGVDEGLPTKEEWHDDEYGEEDWYPEWKMNNMRNGSIDG